MIRLLLLYLFSTCFAGVLIAQEARQKGLVFLDETTYQGLPSTPAPIEGLLPSSYDLAEFFPTPGDQGRQGSCVGWAVAYLKSYQEEVERRWERRIFSPAYVYNQARLETGQSRSCRDGITFRSALNVVHRIGVAPIASFPYKDNDCATLPDETVVKTSREYAIAGYNKVENHRDRFHIKSHLNANLPVLIGMLVDNDFGRLKKGEIYRKTIPSASSGGHAMVVVGYNDEVGAFKVINSWGVGWGDGGFGWIGYESFASLVQEAYVVRDVSPPPPPPVPTVALRPVRFVVPFGAKGPTDQIVQKLAIFFRNNLKADVIVDRIPGGSGMVAPEQMLSRRERVRDDVLLHHNGLPFGTKLFNDLKFDLQKDFVPLGLISKAPMVLLGSNSFEPKMYSALDKWLRSNPGKVRIGHAGLGSNSHRCMWWFYHFILGNPKLYGQTPRGENGYDTTAEAVNQLQLNKKGEIDILCDHTLSVASAIRSGSVKGYVTFSDYPIPALPKVPSIISASGRPLEIPSWYGLYASRHINRENAQKINMALRQFLDDKDIRAWLAEFGITPADENRRTANGHEGWLRDELTLSEAVIKAFGWTTRPLKR